VPDVVLPGDLEAGDLIVLADRQDELIVIAVRLGHGGFLLTVSPSRPGGLRPGESRPELVITLAVGAEIHRIGRMPAATLLPTQVTATNAMDSRPSLP
jgi:hypothetical protein